MIATLTVETLMDDVLLLPRQTRALLAEKLLDSLDVEEEELSTEWEEELRQRVTQVQAGTVRMIPGQDVWAKVDARLQQQP
jgi:putative addiction module component (TIGR02574 family)